MWGGLPVMIKLAGQGPGQGRGRAGAGPGRGRGGVAAILAALRPSWDGADGYWAAGALAVPAKGGRRIDRKPVAQ